MFLAQRIIVPFAWAGGKHHGGPDRYREVSLGPPIYRSAFKLRDKRASHRSKLAGAAQRSTADEPTQKLHRTAASTPDEN